MQRTLIPSPLRRWLWASALAHLGAVAVVLVAHDGSARSAGPTQTVLVTKLVRLGEKRPEHLLPRKEEPPPAAAPKPAPSAVPSPTSKPAPPSKAPSAADRVAELSKMSNALARLKKSVAPAGDPEGSPDGEVSDLSRAILGNKFATEVYRCLKQHYSVEGMEPAQVVGRKATVHLRIGADGRILDFSIAESSKLARFDDAVARAVRMCAKVSAPPKEILETVRDNGIEVVFQP
jgi:protein TonB